MAKRNTTKAPEAEATPEKEPFLSHSRVSLAGRLVADPELRYTPTGKAASPHLDTGRRTSSAPWVWR